MIRRSIALVALLALPAVGRAGAAANVTKKLKIGVIPSPGVMLSESDLKSSGGRYLRLNQARRIIPRNSAALSRSRSHAFSIGGADFTLRLVKNAFFLNTPGGASAKLTPRGGAFISMPVPVPEKRKYVLAFPTVYSSTSGTSVGLRSGSVQKAKIDGKDFAVYDDDLDGFYGAKDTFQVGRACVFAPISKYFTTFSSVYEFGGVDREGGEVTYSPYSGDTGKLSMKYLSRGVVAHVAFGSKDADLNLVLTGRGKDAKVVPGSYEVLYGLATDGYMKKVYAGVVQGEFSPVKVEKDGKTVAVMGGPYRIDFEHAIKGKKLTLEPSSIKLFGRNGERYISFKINGSPTVSIISGGRVAQSGRIPST